MKYVYEYYETPELIKVTLLRLHVLGIINWLPFSAIVRSRVRSGPSAVSVIMAYLLFSQVSYYCLNCSSRLINSKINDD